MVSCFMMCFGFLATGQLWAVPNKVCGETLVIHLKNTGPGSSTNDDDQDFSACYVFHTSLCFPDCYRKPWLKLHQMRAEGWSLSPTGPSKTVPADGAFTSCLATYTFLWRMTIRHLLLSEIQYTEEMLLVSIPHNE